ncbi:hypothetical protein AUJ46_02055 [Candidatus Peregrinibacteria bacterium CG1_02_54_53]|nr:MAG: hypothetical protein AUJ46_02055 [Candidatus Peregrinibacteria bacterium CG1_02_54_53]
MIPLIPIVLGISLALSPTPSAPVLTFVPQTQWRAQIGDRIVVDTQANEGFLMHRDGQTLQFPVATGQRRGVCYIGRCYNATTPQRTWEIRSKDIKGDRITFGPSGRFLRLYWDGESTPYGFHEFAYEDRMFDDQPRYKSMGCIIVKKDVMEILDLTYAVNEGNISVVTKYGIEEPVALAFAPQE